MKSRRRLAVIAFIACGIALSSSGAQAATTLDQSFEYYSTAFSDQQGSSMNLAQMVTAGITGALTSVQVGLYKTGTPTEGVSISVRAAAAGKPTGSDLASVFIPNSAISTNGSEITAAFTSPPSFTAGTQFAIVVS